MSDRVLIIYVCRDREHAMDLALGNPHTGLAPVANLLCATVETTPTMIHCMGAVGGACQRHIFIHVDLYTDRELLDQESFVREFGARILVRYMIPMDNVPSGLLKAIQLLSKASSDAT